MKRSILLFFSILFLLSGCSSEDYYTLEEVEEIRDEYEQRLSEYEGASFTTESELLQEYYNSGYQDGRSEAYMEGYNDGYESGQADPPDSFRENIVWETIHDYPEWLLDSDVTEFWGELYNALAAFWSGNTSDLTNFESGLYDVICDIYSEYKADQTPVQTYTPTPSPPAEQSSDDALSSAASNALTILQNAIDEQQKKFEENKKKLEEYRNSNSSGVTNTPEVNPPSTQTTEPTPADPVPPASYTVYITDTGTKYHSYGCQYLKDSCYPIDKNAAIAKNYGPCSKCHP